MKDETMPPLPEPLDYQFQHEETGLTQTVCGQQVEWGFEKLNPRWKRIGGAYSESQMHAYARAYAAQEVAKDREACAQVCDDMAKNYGSDDHLHCAEAIRARSKP